MIVAWKALGLFIFRLTTGKPPAPTEPTLLLERIRATIDRFVWPPEVLLIEGPHKCRNQHGYEFLGHFESIHGHHFVAQSYIDACSMNGQLCPMLAGLPDNKQSEQMWVDRDVLKRIKALVAEARERGPLLTRANWRPER